MSLLRWMVVCGVFTVLMGIMVLILALLRAAAEADEHFKGDSWHT